MKRSLKLVSKIAGSAALTLLIAAAANADIVTATFAGLGQGNGDSIQTTGSFNGGASESDANGGEFLWQSASFTNVTLDKLQAYPNPVYTTGNLATPFPNGANDFISFCIQLNQNVSFPLAGPYVYTISNLDTAPVPNTSNPGDANGMGLQASQLMEQLWWQHITSHYTPSGNFISVPGNLPVGSQADYALGSRMDAGAFQMVIWKLTYDGSSSNWYNPTAGNIILPSTGDGALATAWLADLRNDAPIAIGGLNANYLGGAAVLVGLTSDNLQDQVSENFYSASLTTAPEPASLLVWGGIVGLAAAFGRRTRRLKK